MSHSQVRNPQGKSEPLQVRNPEGLSAPGRLGNPSEPSERLSLEGSGSKGPRPGSTVRGVGCEGPMPSRLRPPYAKDKPGGSNPPSLANYAT